MCSLNATIFFQMDLPFSGSEPVPATSGHGGKGRRTKQGEDSVVASESYDLLTSSISTDQPPRRTSATERPERNKLKKVGDIEIGDCDDLDLDNDLASLDLGPKVSRPKVALNVKVTPISPHIAGELRTLILGSASAKFTNEWRCQGLTFCDIKRLQYGLVQKKGGPCGVLAAIQAYVLQHLLFPGNGGTATRNLEPTSSMRTRCLVEALCKIFWRAGEAKKAIVTM